MSRRIISVLLVFLLLTSFAVSAAEPSSESDQWHTQYVSCQKEVKGSIWNDVIFTVNLEVWFRYNENIARVDHGLDGYYKLISDNVEVSDWKVTTQHLKDGGCVATCSGVFRWTDGNPVFTATHSAATSKVIIELRCDKHGRVGKTKMIL